jgi:hypothetical protein
MYQYAFFGAYEFFGAWLAWERDEARRGRLAAAAWKQAIELTRNAMGCESYDYTDVFSEIADAIRSIRISQTVNCCGDGGGLLYYNEDGEPVLTPQLPVDPLPPPPPVGDDWPINPDIEPVPEGFDDWTVFDVEACAASNAVWQLATWVVVAAESAAEVAAVIVSIMVVVLGALPAGAVSAIGGASLMEIAEALGQIVLSEQATDTLNKVADWLTEKKEEIVCKIFEYRHDLPGMQFELVRMMSAYLATYLELDEDEAAGVRRFGRSIWPMNLLLKWFYDAGTYIAATDPIDCSLCDSLYGEPIAYAFEVVVFESEHSNESLALVGWGENFAGSCSEKKLWNRGVLLSNTVSYLYDSSLGFSVPGTAFDWERFRYESETRDILVTVRNDNVTGTRWFNVELRLFAVFSSGEGFNVVQMTAEDLTLINGGANTAWDGTFKFYGSVGSGEYQYQLRPNWIVI